MDGMPTPEEIAAQVQRAKDLVLGFASSQVGDHHDFAHLAIKQQIDELEDPQMLYLVLRVFSGITAAFAQNMAGGHTTEPMRREEIAMEAIRVALDGLDFTNPQRR